jgi:hypothetical protein
VREHLVLDRLLEIEDGGQLLVVDVDELSGVACLRRGSRRDDGDDLAGAGHVVHDDGQVVGSLLLRVERPRVGDRALDVLDVGAGDDVDDARSRLGLSRVDGRDAGVGEGAAHQGEVQHAGQLDVVGPTGATRDEALVLLAAPRLADLEVGRCGAGAVVGDRHDGTACELSSPAACCTALTMLW